MINAISLTQLLAEVKQGLEQQFARPYWVRGEVLEIKEHASGHCYLELVEKDEQTQYLGAKVSATIWAKQYRMVKPYFESVVGRGLEAGMKLLIQVKVQFHPLYGFSLMINDIDPGFTLGDIQVQKQKILNRLEQEGLLDMNASLPFPLLPFRIAVISSEQAAGYRDFVQELQFNPYGYRFQVTLFPALMQGADSEASLLAAIRNVYAQYADFDVLVMVRGGGAQADMQSFNGYELAAYIAQFPLPVLTGIGHDKDSSVADEVASFSLKTPTAVAGFLVSRIHAQHQQLLQLQQRLERWLMLFAPRQLERVERAEYALRQAVKGYMLRQNNRLDQWELRLRALDPHAVFQRGYALVEQADGTKIRSVKQLQQAETLRVYVQDGQVKTVIKEIIPYAQEES